MPSQKNLQSVKRLSKQLAHSEGVIFVDYQGMTHRQLEDLRNGVEETGGEFGIAKNTLTRIALGETDPDLTTKVAEDLTGPTANLFLGQDVIGPIKKLAEFVKQYDLPKIKSGILQHRLVSENEVIELSKLPSYEVLIAKLIGQIQAPLYGLVYALSGTTQKLVYALKAIENMKGGETNGKEN